MPYASPTAHMTVTARARPITDLLTSLLPGGMYVVTATRTSSTAAMVLASLVAAAVMANRRRRGASVGPVLGWSLAYLAARTVAGLVSGSEAVYFGAGLLLSVAVAVTVGATAWTRTPVAAHLIPLVARYQHIRPTHPLYRRVTAQATVAWAVAELVMTGLEAWHLTHATGAEFVVVRTTVALPAMAVVVFVLVFYVRARLDPLEFRLAGGGGVQGSSSTPTQMPVTTGDQG